jgi:hypothetical protein
MQDIMPLMTAVLGANGLTVLFIYGAKQAFNYRNADDAPWVVLLAILVPTLVFVGGLFAAL